MKTVRIIRFALLLSLFPLVSLAQFEKTDSLLTGFGGIIDLLSLIAIGLAVMYFFWGLAQFILHSDSEDGVDAGKRRMFWGVIALFVLVSVWAIVRIIQSELLGTGGNLEAPVFVL